MSMPDLASARISDPELARRADAQGHHQALDYAILRAAEAVSDLGLAQLAVGNLQAAVKSLQDALNLAPSSRTAFHNLISTLLKIGELHGGNLIAMQRHLSGLIRQLPWASQYAPVLYLPHFLNVVFVSGKCNLRCRMCFTTRSDDHPNKLEHLCPEDFRRMLQAAPSARGVTLSSGDAEPLLHPDFPGILAVAAEMGVKIDMYTNGQALSAPVCRKMIESGAMGMVNFSIDAATPETYKRIRGGDFRRLIGRIEMIQAMKKELQRERPWVSISFVAMADNIHELPQFVELARKLGAGRVFVEDLSGWDGKPSENKPASENPQWRDYVMQARRLGAELGIALQLPQRFAPEPAARHACCSWIQGVSLNRDGGIGPCCMIHGSVDMGNILNGPLSENEKYVRIKDLLLSGRVLPQCANQANCIYVQQQKAANIPLQVAQP